MPHTNKKSLDDAPYAQIQSLAKHGDKLAQSKRYDDAVKKYKEAIKELPKPVTDWEASTWLYVAIGDARFKQRDFNRAIKSFSNATHCPSGIGNPFIHLRLGQCEFEMNNLDSAADELARAYMGSGKDIFNEDDPKYFDFLKTRLDGLE